MDNTKLIIYSAIIIIGISAVIAVSILFIKTWYNCQDAMLKLKKYEINTNSKINADIPYILDLIIEDCFTDYQVMILVPKNEMYISDDREKEIRMDLVRKVTERLSGEAIEKLSQFYNIRNIDKVIADKIYIAVMNYVVQHNQLITTSSTNFKSESSAT